MASGIWFRFDDATYSAVQSLLERIDQAALDARPAWNKLAERFTDRARRGFAAAGRKPLTPRYARWKARHTYGPTMVMRLTGTAYEAFTEPQTRELSRTDARIGVETRAGRGAWGDLTYIEVANSQRPVWRNLSRVETLKWGEDVLDYLIAAAEGRN